MMSVRRCLLAAGFLSAISALPLPAGLMAQSSQDTSSHAISKRPAAAKSPSAGAGAGAAAKKSAAKGATHKAMTVAKSTAKSGVDSATKAKRVAGLLGPSSGDKHLAFRGMGSELDSLWPPKMPAALPGSLLPAKRIVAFYGNPLSKRMGILGEFEPDDMLQRLDREVAEWNRLDPSHPVQPALHLIAVVAQGSAGRDGKYRLRMDSTMIEKVYGWAKRKNAVLFVDVQVGHSTLREELPWLERFLKRPDVHLGVDPEFSMKDATVPGKKIGTYDAADINYATKFLADIVDKYKLPPKVLIVHRFTRKGVTNSSAIRLDPRVQIVMDMDGFGAPWLKRDSYFSYIKKEPVQFAGWKQFTKVKNDNPSTPREAILRLWPVPLYIQLQ
jgi:hypothetical protein